VNIYAESFATIISQYMSSYCFIEDDSTIAAFYIGYFEGGILDMYLMTSQNITSLSLQIVLELLHSVRQISITSLRRISNHHVIVLHITQISVTVML
jgi:hypothetical protein